MARKKKPEEHANHERWLVSYADFITLLFAFFTTLYAISSVDAKKMGRLVLSMQAAFDPTGFSSSSASSINVMGIGGSHRMTKNSQFYKSVVTRRMLAKALKRRYGKDGKDGKGPGKNQESGKDKDRAKGKGGTGVGEILDALSTMILHESLRDKIRLVIHDHGVVISLAEAGFFHSGLNMVQDGAMPLIDKFGEFLASIPNPIRVEGHTDNIQIHTPRFPSNWDLSTARASYIINRFITRHKINPWRLSASGYGEHRPVASNATAEGRAKNRRVDIVIFSIVPGDPLIDLF